MSFKTYFDIFDTSSKKKKIEPVFSNPGTEFVDTYEIELVDGVNTLVVTGKTNVQEFIDSYAESTDIVNILTRFMNGDTSVLNPREGQYGDFTNVPSTYAEMFDRARQCENLFDSLPIEIKQKFDNSYVKFWSDFGSEYFDTVFNDFNKVQVENIIPPDFVESEVKKVDA